MPYQVGVPRNRAVNPLATCRSVVSTSTIVHRSKVDTHPLLSLSPPLSAVASGAVWSPNPQQLVSFQPSNLPTFQGVRLVPTQHRGHLPLANATLFPSRPFHPPLSAVGLQRSLAQRHLRAPRAPNPPKVQPPSNLRCCKSLPQDLGSFVSVSRSRGGKREEKS